MGLLSAATPLREWVQQNQSLGSSEAGMVLQSCPKSDVTTGATRTNASPWGEGITWNEWSAWVRSRPEASCSWEPSTATTPQQPLTPISPVSPAGDRVAQQTHRHCMDTLLWSSGIPGARFRPFPGKVVQNTRSRKKQELNFLLTLKNQFTFILTNLISICYISTISATIIGDFGEVYSMVSFTNERIMPLQKAVCYTLTTS